MTCGYATDLAYIHDVGFGDFAQNAAPGLLQLLRQHGIASGLVVDLGCGSGILARALNDAGFDCLGVDVAAAMLALAKRNAPRAKFKKASLLRIRLPRCAAVTSIGECLNYQFDEHRTADLQTLFARIYEALLPGGVFIFDVLQPGVQKAVNPQRIYSEGKDWAILVEKEEDAPHQQLTRRMTIFRKVGTLYRRSAETHVVQLYAASVIEAQLRQAGFRVRRLRGYGALRFRPAHSGFLARKG